MKKTPKYWWINLNDVQHISGSCARCGLLYETNKKFQKADPEEELCQHCETHGRSELHELNKEA